MLPCFALFTRLLNHVYVVHLHMCMKLSAACNFYEDHPIVKVVNNCPDLRIFLDPYLLLPIHWHTDMEYMISVLILHIPMHMHVYYLQTANLLLQFFFFGF